MTMPEGRPERRNGQRCVSSRTGKFNFTLRIVPLSREVVDWEPPEVI